MTLCDKKKSIYSFNQTIILSVSWQLRKNQITAVN